MQQRQCVILNLVGKVSAKLIDDIDKDTVEFKENYDGLLKEPQVLPAKFPNILTVTGGIALEWLLIYHHII